MPFVIGEDTAPAVNIYSAVLALLSAAGAVIFAVELLGKERRIYRELRQNAAEYSKGNFKPRTKVSGSSDATQLAAEFNEMAEALSNLEKMRADFISSVSHDMRTPMTTISGYIDCILGDVIPPSQTEKYLGLIKSEVMRLSRLISRMLDITRIEAGDREFEIREFDICDLAKTVLFSFEKRIDDEQLEVSFESDQDRLYVLADPDSVHQILYNLFDNAVKFSKTGGKLDVNIAPSDGMIECSVRNEGQGIAAEDIPFVFDRFYKCDRTRGLDKTGYGLGLYISKMIADAQGAKLECESVEGEYCLFRLKLPAAPQTTKGNLNEK